MADLDAARATSKLLEEEVASIKQRLRQTEVRDLVTEVLMVFPQFLSMPPEHRSITTSGGVLWSRRRRLRPGRVPAADCSRSMRVLLARPSCKACCWGVSWDAVPQQGPVVSLACCCCRRCDNVVRDVQGELRVSKENLRRMDDRMRGILRERTEMASQIKAMSPAKPK